jgi:hypothetical protein
MVLMLLFYFLAIVVSVIHCLQDGFYFMAKVVSVIHCLRNDFTVWLKLCALYIA